MALTGVFHTPYGNTAPNAYCLILSASWNAGPNPEIKVPPQVPPVPPVPWNEGTGVAVVNIWNSEQAHEDGALVVYGQAYQFPYDPTTDGSIYDAGYAALQADALSPAFNWRDVP